jgi:hypothetical protein
MYFILRINSLLDRPNALVKLRAEEGTLFTDEARQKA